MTVSPELKASFRRFQQQKRAWYSLLTLTVLLVVALPAELLCNNRPLLIRYGGRWYVPAVERYTEKDFGGQRAVEPDYGSARFQRLIGALPAETARPDGGAGHPQPRANREAWRFLDDFDPEPHDVPRSRPTPAGSLLDDFDDEGDDMPVDNGRASSPVDDFDPEPQDVVPPEVAPIPLPRPRPPGDYACWVLWPPVRYDYAHISMRSTSGREALASPWGQTLAATGERLGSSWADGHYLGTDDRGRDVLARLVYGFRVSLVFGLLLAVSATVVGCVLGALQGYFGGWVDLLGQRVTEIWGSLPQLYLLMILSSLLARSIHVLFVILNLTSWMGMAAYMRAEFLRGRGLDYVRAAKALGVKTRSIMFRHILPNSLTPVITFLPFSVSGGILALVSLDFLGLGVPSPFPSLGELLAQGQANLHATWIILPTFAVLSGTITLLTFIGDGLRNAFDPRKTVRGT